MDSPSPPGAPCARTPGGLSGIDYMLPPVQGTPGLGHPADLGYQEGFA